MKAESPEKQQLHAEILDLKSIREAQELKIKALEQRLQQNNEKSWSGDWELDLGTKEVKWSESMYQLLGIDTKIIPDMKLFNGRLPADSQDKLNGAIKKTFVTKENYSFEHCLLQGDEERRVRTDLKLVLGKDQKPLRLMGNTMDITSIKSAQQELERLSLIASNTSNAIVIIETDTKIEWVNKGFTSATGYRFNEIKGMEFKWLLYPNMMESWSQGNLKSELDKSNVFTQELRLKTKRQNEVWALVSATPILDYELNPESYIVIMSDITKQKQTERQLRDQKIELEHAMMALTRAQIGRKSLTITFLVAIFLFIVSEVFVDPVIESYFDQSAALVLSGKLFLAIALKPIEDGVKRGMIRSEVKKRRKQE